MMRYSTSLLAVLAMGAAACDDDDTAGDTDTSADTTETDTTETDSTETDTTETDTTPVDPCDPNPCDSAPATACNADNTGTIAYAAAGVCTDNGGNAACAYAETPTACASEELCSASACTALPAEYVPSPASYINSLDLATGENAGGLNNLLGLFAAGGLDVGESILEAIESGSLTLVFDFPGLDGVNDQTGLSMNGYIGRLAATSTQEAASAGTGNFTVDTASFVEGTFLPQISLPGGITAGTLTAGPGDFILNIPVPDVGDIALSLVGAEITSTVSIGANSEGLAHADGVLTAAVSLDDLAITINNLIESCTCIGLPDGAEGLIVGTKESGGKELNCSAELTAATPACTADDGSLCEGLGDNKTTVCSAGALIIGFLDVDQDGDGNNDSFKAGLVFTGVSATIDGVTATE